MFTKCFIIAAENVLKSIAPAVVKVLISCSVNFVALAKPSTFFFCLDANPVAIEELALGSQRADSYIKKSRTGLLYMWYLPSLTIRPER